MRFTAFILLLILCTVPLHTVSAQSSERYLPEYGAGTTSLVSTPGTYACGLGAVWNPAVWGAMGGFEAGLTWNDRSVRPGRMDNWGAYAGGHGLGFAVRQNDFLYSDGGPYYGSVTDYQLALAGGGRLDYWGVSYGWSRGDTDQLERQHHLTLGSLVRPDRHASIGTAAAFSLKSSQWRCISDLGIRPFGHHFFTLFGDAAYGHGETFKTMQWGAGAEVRPLDGVSVAAKISKPFGKEQDKIYSLSFGLAIEDGLGFSVIPHYNKDSELSGTSYHLRVGDQEPVFSPERTFLPKRRVAAVEMKGLLVYRKARLLDEDRIAFWEMLQFIDEAKRDRRVGALALNLSDFRARRAMVWELREKLKEFKAEGKKVYVYLDRAAMTNYYLASVADYIWMDPSGMLILPGYLSGRTYYRDMLGKLGLGVEEWRFFDYKSAFEAFSRTDMSEKDREQRLAMLSDFMDDWTTEISRSRQIPEADLRAVVDTMLLVLPEDALTAGLIDTVARWSDIHDVLEAHEDRDISLLGESDVAQYPYPDPAWGPYPRIAVVYALGTCDMDEGIRGRYTSRLLRKLAQDDDIEAVVLRVDSPGGDALPSDLVAEQMKTVAEKKPMIVTQGGLAASGGYWISMNGDRIFSTPQTITGSIGVIGGWIWNDGLTEKTGLKSDHVKIGEHADTGFGVTLPLLGIQVPDRNLTDEEHARVEQLLRYYYKYFTTKVADGRSLETAYVDSIGQGRIWTGTRAVDNGLVDEIGGLESAIEYAKRESGFHPRRKVEIVEYPKRSWINFDRLFGSKRTTLEASLDGSLEEGDLFTLERDYESTVLRRYVENRGMPLYLLPPELLPEEEGKSDLLR